MLLMISQEAKCHEKKKSSGDHRDGILRTQSTSIYWVPLYEILENRGFEVFLVNPKDLKNVSGRKPALAPAAPRGAAGQGPILRIASGFSNCTPTGCCVRPFARPVSSSSCAIWFGIATICCTIALRTFCTCRKTCT